MIPRLCACRRAFLDTSTGLERYAVDAEGDWCCIHRRPLDACRAEMAEALDVFAAMVEREFPGTGTLTKRVLAALKEARDGG